jgi:hypothetical protein
MLTRPIRRAVALFAALGLAFAQLATSAYACPLQGSGVPLAEAHAASAPGPAGHPCSGPAPEPVDTQTNACEVHCTDGLTLPASPDLPPVVLAALRAPAGALAALAAADLQPRTPPAARPGAPPLTLQFCRLLI